MGAPWRRRVDTVELVKYLYGDALPDEAELQEIGVYMATAPLIQGGLGMGGHVGIGHA